MGTEVAVSFSTLRAQLESEKSSLCKIDENIKKIVQTSGRFQNDRFNNSSGDYQRGGVKLGGRHSFPDGANNHKNDELFSKRKHETKTVFSRLSTRTNESDNEDGPGGVKRMRVSSAVSRELPTRAAVLRAQGDDEQARTRNRRIFGSLLGTLQKFKQEEIVLQTKEDKKAQVERKIEEQARLQKEKEIKERKTLFAERELKKATIKALEAKMARVQEFETWEKSQRSLANFILTKAKPNIYWIPRKMNDKANELLNTSRKYHDSIMANKKQELKEELTRIEQRCLQTRRFGAKENNHDADGKETNQDNDEEKGKKRDKFAMDVDEKDNESDGEEHTQPKATDSDSEPKEEKETEDTKIDTNTEQPDKKMETEDLNGKEAEDSADCESKVKEEENNIEEKS